MQKIKWGILGAGNIAHRFAKGLAFEENSELYAIACRNMEKAKAFVEEFPAEKIYTSYMDLLEDPELDCIYLALPHGLHAEWAIEALKRKKAVLCEKPATLSAEQMQSVIDCAKENNTLFIEAMKQRFLPIYDDIKEALKRIGEIKSLEVQWCRGENFPRENLYPESPNYDKRRREGYFFDPVQGGSLLDTGTYCASWLDDFLGKEFTVKNVLVRKFDGVDVHVKAELDFNGKMAILECGCDTNLGHQAIFTGEKGQVVVYNQHRPEKYLVSVKGEGLEVYERAYDKNDFYSEVHELAECLLQNKKESTKMPYASSLNCAKILDEIRKGF